MPFVGTEFPKRTRKGSTKYAEELESMVKRPNQVYEFEVESEVPGAIVAALRNNKFVAELAEENNGQFVFTSASGKVYGKFTPNGRVNKSKKVKKGKK